MAKPETVERWIEEAGIDAERVKYRKSDGEPVVWESCFRCGGTGIFQGYGACGVWEGVCFGCGGSKGRYVKLQSKATTARNRPRKAQKAAERREREKAEAPAQARAFLAAHEGLAAALRHERAKSSILRSFANQLARRGGLSDRQVEVAFEIASRPPKPADPTPVPVVEGRHEITGKVLTVREQASQFGYQLKMLVQVEAADGAAYKVWGTVPRSIDTVERGAQVSFTATVERSKDDENFGFFKRPANAAVVEETV